MKLHCIDEITNGLQVFMPSGLVATLYKEPDKIKVIYPDGLGTITNEISYKDFEELIADGISTLRDDLSIALSVSESLNEDELDDELEADRIDRIAVSEINELKKVFDRMLVNLVLQSNIRKRVIKRGELEISFGGDGIGVSNRDKSILMNVDIPSEYCSEDKRYYKNGLDVFVDLNGWIWLEKYLFMRNGIRLQFTNSGLKQIKNIFNKHILATIVDKLELCYEPDELYSFIMNNYWDDKVRSKFAKLLTVQGYGKYWEFDDDIQHQVDEACAEMTKIIEQIKTKDGFIEFINSMKTNESFENDKIALNILCEDELDDELEADRITKWDLLKEELLSEDFDCSSLYDSFGYMTGNSEYGADLRSIDSRHGEYIASAGCFDPYLRFDADDLRMTDSYFQDIYDNQLEWDWRYLFDETSECFYGTEFSFDWKLGADDDYGYRYYIGLIPDYSSFKLTEIGADRIIEQLKNPTNEDDESIIHEWLFEDGRDIVDDISSNNFYDLNLDDDCFEFNAKFMKDLTILAQHIEAWEANYEDINYWKETIEANEWVDEEWEEEHEEEEWAKLPDLEDEEEK